MIQYTESEFNGEAICQIYWKGHSLLPSAHSLLLFNAWNNFSWNLFKIRTLNCCVAGSNGYSIRYGWLQHFLSNIIIFCSLRFTSESMGMLTSTTGLEKIHHLISTESVTSCYSYQSEKNQPNKTKIKQGIHMLCQMSSKSLIVSTAVTRQNFYCHTRHQRHEALLLLV